MSEKFPIYSIDSFRNDSLKNVLFQVEPFDAHRHFNVTYPHRHTFYEILFLSKGAGKHTIDDIVYEVVPPCIFFLSPGQAHSLKLSHDIEGFIFLFNSEFYSSSETNRFSLLEFPFFFSLPHKNTPISSIQQHDAEFLHVLFAKASAVFKNSAESSALLLKSILQSILFTCVDLYKEINNVQNLSRGHILTKQFYMLLEEHFLTVSSVEEYASMLAITQNHFTQVVKNITGQTPIQIIQEKRILEIKRLLKYSSLSVSEIAHYMNFTDVSYLTKFFKKYCEKTPLEYKRNLL